MNQRIDELDKYFTPIAACDKWAGYVFLASAILSILIPRSDLLPPLVSPDLVSILFIILVVMYSVLSHFNGFYLIPTAEGLRRKQLLSDAFGVPLTPERTKLFYNNEISPSILRLGANVMENTFFAKNVCAGMAKRERLKVFLYFAVWLFAILNRSTDLGLILAVTQLLFSGEILVRWLKIEVLGARTGSIYGTLYQLYLGIESSAAISFEASILDAYASYESAKSAAAIKQSSKIFNKLNPALTLEWEGIREQLGIDRN